MTEHELALTLVALGGLLLAGLGAEWLGRRTRVPGVTLLVILGVLAGPSGLSLLPAQAETWMPILSTVALMVCGFTGISLPQALKFASTTVTDDDDDSLTTTFAWTVEGGSVSASSTSGLTSTLAGAFAAGDAVVCTVTTDDGKGGTDSASAGTTITNTAPTVSAVTLDKSTLYTNDTLTASVTSSDPEGDTLTTTYDWYVAGASVQNGTSDTLNGASTSVGFDKSDDVYVIVNVTDGIDTVTSTSSTLTVSNTPPGASVTLSSGPVYTNDTIPAVVSTDDDDGDSVGVSYAWYVDGSVVAETSSTLDGATDFDKEQEVYVIITPNDGSVDGSSETSSSVEIANSLPTAPDVELVEEGTTTFAQLAASGHHSCVLESSGGIECWGDDTNGGVSDAPTDDGRTFLSRGG